MTEQPPVVPPAPPRTHEPHEPPEPALMPRWVPVLIGVVLVFMALLAVFTGSRFRETSLVGMVKPHKPSRPLTSAAPPGEPEAGASLMFPGESGDNAPVAHPPVAGASRAVVTGGKNGIAASVRLSARRGMMTHVVPGDALVYVNDVAVGQADQFNTENEIYDFPAPGSYTVRLVAPGYRDRQFVITVAEDAKPEIAKLDVKLEKQ
ncbi:MAG TPA: PEGA domain-containing protein [Gemmatimonadaceae bacterium]